MIVRPLSLALLCLVWLVASVGRAQSPGTAPADRRFALVSDPHVSVDPAHADYLANFERVIDDVNAAKVEAVLVAGDLTQSGDAASIALFTEKVKRLNAPACWVPGNHDLGDKPMPGRKSGQTIERVERYEKALGPAFYAADVVPGVRVVAIASSLLTSGLPAEAAQWSMLERELAPRSPADQDRPLMFLLTHYPPFVVDPNEADEYFNINGPARSRLIALIARSNVTAVLSGHLHRPLGTMIGRVPDVGAPAVSFGLPKGKQDVGWTLVTLHADGRVDAEQHPIVAAPAPAPATRPVGEMLQSTTAPTTDRVQIFYYGWYGAPPLQKSYVHWQQGGHTPPDDIGSNYYPALGAYDSGDPSVLKQHMEWIRRAGVGTLVLTWWGRDSYEEKDTRAVLDAAADSGLKVAFHLEPYRGLTPTKLADDVGFLLAKYGKHPALYRAAFLGNKPLFYVFESTRHPPAAWQVALEKLRADASEPFLILAQTSDLRLVEAGGFDGGYPYDGLAPFTHPEFLLGWHAAARDFAAAGKLFVPSVGPGYWDDRAVPKSGADEPEAARTRDGGRATHYDAAWTAAIAMNAPLVTVTSFNEWHEGSQIEPAVAKRIDAYEYPAYPGGECQYLDRTAAWAKRFLAKLEHAN